MRLEQKQSILPAMPASPCTGVCEMTAAGHCRGCGRHLNEIAEWGQAAATRRRQILAQSARRLVAQAERGMTDSPTDGSDRR